MLGLDNAQSYWEKQQDFNLPGVIFPCSTNNFTARTYTGREFTELLVFRAIIVANTELSLLET